jgi:DNA-directed RNA polymerase subunit RPC12/RpoP
MKKFTMIDESFICSFCKKEVAPLGYSARDHCPYCLYSKHVDINPGDRQEACHGLLKAIAVDKAKNDTYKIVYKCEKCNQKKRNKVAHDDNLDLIIKIMTTV